MPLVKLQLVATLHLQPFITLFENGGGQAVASEVQSTIASLIETHPNVDTQLLRLTTTTIVEATEDIQI